MRWFFLTGCALVFVAGCAATASPLASPSVAEPTRASAAAPKPPADADDEPIPTDPAIVARARTVKVLKNEGMGCAAEALGPVDVHKKMESTDKALEVLKLRAAALGAEAVIGVDFEHGEGGSAPTHLSGMAVRCRDLIQGRQYDVIGSISIKGAMGKEEDAFAQLRAKATAMKADLVLDVTFEHGEGADGAGTTIKGTAIRFRSR
jgi:uncharacterized protein YbjQ (UPF0145 family)